jgi:hypothetical protein
MDGVLVEIQIGLLLNIREKVYHLSHLAEWYGGVTREVDEFRLKKLGNRGWQETQSVGVEYNTLFLSHSSVESSLQLVEEEHSYP